MSVDAAAPTRTEYERLPEAIRRLYNEREYAWLGDARRAQLMDAELEPEHVE